MESDTIYGNITFWSLVLQMEFFFPFFFLFFFIFHLPTKDSLHYLSISSSFQVLIRVRKMGRGKIEIKRIENSTNRQVTYSKRRGGIMKKAKELTVLCDAQVSLIMFSSTGKFSEYCSPSTTTKNIFDRYQQASGTSLWNSHYERMQGHLIKLKEENNNLRREIRQRIGEDLDDLEIEELHGLEQNLESSIKVVRERKYHVIQTQTETYKKKLRSLNDEQAKLIRVLEGQAENGAYGLVENGGPDYESALVLANGGAHSLHDTGFGIHDLRLA